MPAMARVEQVFCRSAPWRAFAAHVVLPWALQGIEPRGALLELGSGSGAMAESTARRYPQLQITATDIDPGMVAAAEQRLVEFPHAHAEQADVMVLPFPDESFDIVASYLMLHHVIEWRRALDEIARVLKPGGTLVGYDLDDTPVAQAIHLVDRSPYRLIKNVELRPALLAAGFDGVAVRRSFGRHANRFLASKPRPSTE